MSETSLPTWVAMIKTFVQDHMHVVQIEEHALFLQWCCGDIPHYLRRQILQDIIVGAYPLTMTFFVDHERLWISRVFSFELSAEMVHQELLAMQEWIQQWQHKIHKLSDSTHHINRLSIHTSAGLRV